MKNIKESKTTAKRNWQMSANVDDISHFFNACTELLSSGSELEFKEAPLMKPYPRIENSVSTGRLKLDILTLEDYDFISSLVNTIGWIEYIGDRNVHSKNDAIAYINKILSTENLFYWVVRIIETNIPIGIISFLKRKYLENFDIGFAFLPDYGGNGYAFEATKEILLMVSKNAEFKPVLATTIPSNEKSIKLLTKLGFSFEKEIEFENQQLAVYTNKVLH